jgi:hypothetical protein
LLLSGSRQGYHPVGLPLLRLFGVRTAWPLARRDSGVVVKVLHRMVLVASVLAAVPLSPSDCMGQAVGMGRVVAQLDDLCLAHTCSCYCTQAELEGRLGDIGQLVRQLRIVLVLQNEPVQCELELGQLGQLALVACSKPQLVAAVVCQELVND